MLDDFMSSGKASEVNRSERGSKWKKANNLWTDLKRGDNRWKGKRHQFVIRKSSHGNI